MKEAKSAHFELRMQRKSPHIKTHQWVYQLLRSNLLCGRISPGIALTIRGLAELLDVSPMPVREALHRLASEGAVEVKDNRRVIVPVMTAGKFNELCELRILLETHAAVSALPHISHADIKKLEALDAQIDSAVESEQVEELSLNNQSFHRCLYQTNPFQRSLPLIESIWLQLGPFSRIIISKLAKTYLVDRHQEAIDAIKQNDSVKLHNAIEADIRDGIASIKSIEGFHQYFESVA